MGRRAAPQRTQRWHRPGAVARALRALSPVALPWQAIRKKYGAGSKKSKMRAAIQEALECCRSATVPGGPDVYVEAEFEATLADMLP